MAAHLPLGLTFADPVADEVAPVVGHGLAFLGSPDSPHGRSSDSKGHASRPSLITGQGSCRRCDDQWEMPAWPGWLWGGRYQVERHPSVAQCTRTWPLPGSASAAGQSQGVHPTTTRPGAHRWPCSHSRGYGQSENPPASTRRLEHTYE